MPRGRKPKDPFADLDQGLRDAIASMQDEEIRKRIAETTLNKEATETEMKNDGDVKEKRFALTEAKRGYTDAIKYQKTLIKYCRQILENRGKDAGTACGK